MNKKNLKLGSFTINSFTAKHGKTVVFSVVFLCLFAFLNTTNVSAAGDVGGVVKAVWGEAQSQIKTVVNDVVFPCLDIILVVALFAKAGCAYFDYRKQGMFDWVAPAVLFVCLIFCLLAPTFIWTIV